MSMKKIILFTSLLLGGAALAQNVNIPDANFKAYLVGNTSINTNMDTEIQVTEAAAFVGMLNCPNLGITDMTGVEAFPGLTQIRCQQNQLTSLDVSQNLNITQLHCYGNSLTSLDVSANTQLAELYCAQNQLTSLTLGANSTLWKLECNVNNLTALDVTQNTGLIELRCQQNGIASLDVSNCTSLSILICGINSLSTIDLTQNTALTFLSCTNNNLTTLDITQNTALTQVSCDYNQISSLDLSQNSSLEAAFLSNNQLLSLDLAQNSNLLELDFDNNQVTNLDVSQNTLLEYLDCRDNALTELLAANGNNTNLTTFRATGNPGLTCIEVDDSTYSATNWTEIDGTAAFSENCGGGSVGIEEEIILEVAVFPNPCFDRLNIEGSVLSVEVYDLSGKVVQSEQTNSFSVENLKKGMYLIKIETPDGLRRAQFIKQ